MGLGNLTEVNGACSAVWYQLCSVASYKKIVTLSQEGQGGRWHLCIVG